jgi:hypothetical protein
LHTSHQTRPFRSSSDDHQFLKREVFGKVWTQWPVLLKEGQTNS